MSMEDSLFNTAKLKNGNLTRDQWEEKRKESLARASTLPHEVTDIGGVLMQEKPNADELAEMTEDNRKTATGR